MRCSTSRFELKRRPEEVWEMQQSPPLWVTRFAIFHVYLWVFLGHDGVYSQLQQILRLGFAFRESFSLVCFFLSYSGNFSI